MVALSNTSADDGKSNADCCLLLNNIRQPKISSYREVPLTSPTYSKPKFAHWWNRSSCSRSLLRSELMSNRNPKHELSSWSRLLLSSFPGPRCLLPTWSPCLVPTPSSGQHYERLLQASLRTIFFLGAWRRPLHCWRTKAYAPPAPLVPSLAIF